VIKGTRISVSVILELIAEGETWDKLLAGEIIYALYQYDAAERRKQNYMNKKRLAKSAKEFDRRFDEGEDIHDIIDMSKTRVVRHGKKIRITLDVAEELVNEIDQIRKSIGVDRGALIKVWLHERLQKEKATISKQ